MAGRRRSSTVRRRRLSTELKKRREAAGKTTEGAAAELGWSRAKITYIETNRWNKPSSDDVAELLDLYGAEEPEKNALLGLVRDARKRGWWTKYSDVLGAGTYTGLEAESALLRSYDCVLISGLLQTVDYAEAIMRVGRINDDAEISRRLEARRTRQQILDTEDAPEVRAIIDEAAVRKVVGSPAVMREQLQHLQAMNDRPNFEIRILPDTAGAHQAMNGQFVIMDFPEEGDMPVVFIESAHSGLFLEEPEEIDSYTLIYDSLRSLALSTDESNMLIGQLTNQLSE